MASSVRLLRSTGLGSMQLVAPPARSPTLARAFAIARCHRFVCRAPLQQQPAARTDPGLASPATPPVTPEPRVQPAVPPGVRGLKRSTGAHKPADAGSTTDASGQQTGPYDAPLERSCLPEGAGYDDFWAQCLVSSHKSRQGMSSRGARFESLNPSWSGIISDRPDLALKMLFRSSSLPWLAGGPAPPKAALARLLHKSPASKRAHAAKIIDLATEQFDDPHVLSGAIKLLTRQQPGPDMVEAFAKLERRILEVGPTWQGRSDVNLFVGALDVIDSVRPGFQRGAHALTFEAAWLFTVCFRKLDVPAHRRRLDQAVTAHRGMRAESRPSSVDLLGFLDPSVRWASRDPITALYILHFYVVRLRPSLDAPTLQLPERIDLLVDGLSEISSDEWAATPGPEFAERNAWKTAKDLFTPELRSALKQNAAQMDALLSRFTAKPPDAGSKPTARRGRPRT